MDRKFFLSAWAALLGAVSLSGCENTAGSYMIDGDRNHSITLVREQKLLWSDEVQQEVVVARFPQCQRRYPIAADKTGSAKTELFGVRPMLFVLHQGSHWYALSTETCELQKFQSPPDKHGQLLGSFTRRNDMLVFQSITNTHQ